MSKEEEGFSGDGLELMAELTHNQKNTGEHFWTLAGPRGVHLQSATAVSWHKVQFQHLWFASCKKNKYYKAENTISTTQYSGLTGVVGKTLNSQHTQQRYVKHQETFNQPQ